MLWGVVGNSSGKSQELFYSKLKNYPETQHKSHKFNFATVAILHFNKGCLRRELERKGFFLSGESCEETLFLLIDKSVFEIVSTGDLQLSKKSERQNIRKINSMERSKQMKSVKV